MCIPLLPIRAAFLAYLILLDFVIVIVLSEGCTIYGAPHYVVFSNLLSLQLSSIRTFSSVPSSQTPSVYVLPLMPETKFNTHTEPQAKL
jgi:hypothetical protein